MTIVFEKPRNYLEKITELYAFVSSSKDGEGVIAKSMENPDGTSRMMPFVCADKARMESLKPLAIKIAQMQKMNVKLIKLTQREVIEEYNFED